LGLFLNQDFFQISPKREKYDFEKVMMFNLLYLGDNDVEKANMFYLISHNPASKFIENNTDFTTKLIHAIESSLLITCVLVGDILESKQVFKGDKNEAEFQNLRKLFAN
jgi:hypothetical protein